MAEQPEHERGTSAKDHGDRDTQIAALTEIIGNLADQLRRVDGKVNHLAKKTAAKAEPDGKEEDPSEPGAWVWYIPPAATEDDPGVEQDPRWTVENFVTWYNVTFVGTDGSRSRPIPDCWRHHPGLTMEVASLAYAWRAANVGPGANSRDAQYWLHQWRPGFADRLTREWSHPDCFDGEHRDSDPPPRDDRFTLAEQHAAAVERASE